MSKKRKKEIDFLKVYDVANVECGCMYWFDKLLAFVMSMFEWQGLPKTLPSYEIESNLILTGHCTVFNSEGELITNKTYLFGDDLYLQPTNATSAVINRPNKRIRINRIFKGYGQNGINGVTFYNSILKEYTLGIPTDSSLKSFLLRYARMLSDIDSTISIYTVNIRDTYIPTATDGKVKSQLEEFYEKRANGERCIIIDDNILPNLSAVNINHTTSEEDLNSLLIAKDKILEQFFRDIGVKFYNPKKAQVTESEVESNDNLLVISTDDLYKARLKGCEEINSTFNLNVSVDFSDTFKKIRGEV